MPYLRGLNAKKIELFIELQMRNYTMKMFFNASEDIMIQNPCEDFSELLEEMPKYTSWQTADLEDIVLRYRQIILKMCESEQYRGYQWLADICPNLRKKVQDMLAEQDTNKRVTHFNSIVFEIEFAIEVITDSIDCTKEAWPLMLSERSLRRN